MSSCNRRSFLRGGLLVAAGAAFSTCSGKTVSTAGVPAFVEPSAEQVRAAEAARHPGAARDVVLTAQRALVDLGGKVVDTWSYDGRIPGAQIRVKSGGGRQGPDGQPASGRHRHALTRPGAAQRRRLRPRRHAAARQGDDRAG